MGRAEGAAVVVAARAAVARAATAGAALEPKRACLYLGRLEGGLPQQHTGLEAARRRRSLQANSLPDVYQEAGPGIKSMGRGECLPPSMRVCFERS